MPYTLLIGLAERLKSSDRKICCTLQGEDLFLEGLPEPYRTDALDLIRAHVKHVDMFIAVSEYYARFMPGYLNIPAEKIRVVPLGINTEGYEAKRERSDEKQPFTIGYFARVAPEKGLHLLAALTEIRGRDDFKTRARGRWHLGAENKDYLKNTSAR